MLADHVGEFEAVQFRHADVDQDDRDLGLEQIFQGLLGRGRVARFLPSSFSITS